MVAAVVIRASLLAAALLVLSSPKLGPSASPPAGDGQNVHEHLELTATKWQRSGPASVEHWHAGTASGTFSARASALSETTNGRYISGTFRVHTRGGIVAFSLVGSRREGSTDAMRFAGQVEASPGSGKYVDVTGRGRFRAFLDLGTRRLSVDIETTYGPLPPGQHAAPVIHVM